MRMPRRAFTNLNLYRNTEFWHSNFKFTKKVRSYSTLTSSKCGASFLWFCQSCSRSTTISKSSCCSWLTCFTSCTFLTIDFIGCLKLIDCRSLTKVCWRLASSTCLASQCFVQMITSSTKWLTLTYCLYFWWLELRFTRLRGSWFWRYKVPRGKPGIKRPFC